MLMDRERIRSSNIRSVGYDPLTQTLEIEFHGGRIYLYANVPTTVNISLMQAGSKGYYFYKHIRERYPTKRIR